MQISPHRELHMHSWLHSWLHSQLQDIVDLLDNASKTPPDVSSEKQSMKELHRGQKSR